MSDNKICKTTVEADGISLEFSNGHVLDLSLASFPESVVKQAALFGLRRKITNSFADVKGDVVKAVEAAKSAADQLLAGSWTAPREVSTSTRAISDLVEAICRLTGKDPDTVSDKLDAMTKEQRSVLRRNSKVAVALLEIRKEREEAKAAAAGSDLDIF